MKPLSNKQQFSDPVLLIQSDGLPRFVNHVDGITTGLNDIGFFIIEDGFAGVRPLAVPESDILWQVQLDTPEGVFFALLCETAQRGHPLPSIEQVLTILHPFLDSDEGRE